MEKEKFLLNCATFHSKYSNAGNFTLHVPSSINGGSEFNMSVHDPEKEIISMKIKKDGCFECDILRPLISALKNSKNASLIDMGGNIGMYSLHAASHGRNAKPLQTDLGKSKVNFESYFVLLVMLPTLTLLYFVYISYEQL